jgi:CRP-like cAMP-binding protein
MHNLYPTLPRVNLYEKYTFRRRELLPLENQDFLQIEVGAVRTFTLIDDGTPITLGFWGPGEVLSHNLAGVRPHIAECLTEVKILPLKSFECQNYSQTLLTHLHDTQALLQMRTGRIQSRLELLLDWLANKFGRHYGQGQLIQLRLTHQEIADTLGTSRVTVTRLLSQMEQAGRLSWVKQYMLLCGVSELVG